MSHQPLILRSTRASTKSNTSTISTISYAATGKIRFLAGCFGAEQTTEHLVNTLAYQIQRGNTRAVERLLRKIKIPSKKLMVEVKRQQLSPNFRIWSNRNQDPFVYFHQECSPVIWAIDNQKWQLLPVLAKYGLDPNRPQLCSRWNNMNSNARSCVVPYKTFWTKGHYTYQSALDYFFASIYEFLRVDMQRQGPAAVAGSAPSSFFYFFQQLPELLKCGIDVHRVDSVILFNSLGYSFDWYMTRYTNENAVVPDIPEESNSFIEIFTVKTLIQNGFSQFECLEFLSSSHNWFGLLFSVLCHPKMDLYNDKLLPPIIQEAALLLINLLALRSAYPNADEIKESLENLSLRKLYSKRYSEKRVEFNQRLSSLQEACMDFRKKPFSLRMLSRNVLRKSIGGFGFAKQVASLNCPHETQSFIQYINHDSLHLCHMPSLLCGLARGHNVFAEQSCA